MNVKIQKNHNEKYVRNLHWALYIFLIIIEIGFCLQAHNRLVADLDANKMEVLETQSFATEVSSALEKLKEKDVRIILGNFDEVWARRIFCEAHK